MTRGELAPQLLRAGLVLFCISLPVSLPLNDMAIALIVLASLLEGNFSARFKGFSRNLLLLPVVFYGLHITGLLYTENFKTASNHLETKAALLLLPLALGTTRLFTPTLIRSFFRVFILSNLGGALVCLGNSFYQYAQTGIVNKLFYYDLTSLFNLHPVYFALYLAISILSILYFSTTANPLFGKRMEVFLILFFLVFIFMLTALVVMLVLPILMGYFVYRNRLGGYSQGVRVTIFSMGIAVMLLLAYSLPYTRNKLVRVTQLSYSLDDPDYKWGSLTIRLAKWECSWALVKEHFLTGVGTGDAQDALMDSYRRKGFAEGLRNNYNTHNQYLETWTMLGIPGLAVLLWMVWPFRMNWLWQSFMILLAASLFTENMLDTQKGVVFIGFFYALLAGPFAKYSKAEVTECLGGLVEDVNAAKSSTLGFQNK